MSKDVELDLNKLDVIFKPSSPSDLAPMIYRSVPSSQLGRLALDVIKKRIYEDQTIDSFWQGLLNHDLMISAPALNDLHQSLIKIKNRNLEELKKAPLEINKRTVNALIFHKWLLLALNDQSDPHPFQIPEEIECPEFDSQTLDIDAYSQLILILEYNKNRRQQLTPNRIEKFTATIKRDLAKFLGDTMLVIALEELKYSFKKTEEFILTVNLLIYFGNHKELWDLCLISNVTIPYREINPFAREVEWKRAIDAELALSLVDEKYLKHKNDPLFVNTMVVISLMRDTQVLSEWVLNHVLEVLNEPQRLPRAGGLLFIRVTRNNKPDFDIYLSPITEYYLRQYFKILKKKGQAPELTNTLSNDRFYSLLGKAKTTLKLEGFKSWKHAINNYLLLEGRIPGLMLAYHRGDFESTTIKATTISRILQIENELNLIKEQSANGLSPQNIAGNKRIKPTLFWSRLRKILTIHHIPSKKVYEIHKGIQLQIDELIASEKSLPIEKLIAKYARYLIDKQVAEHAIEREGVRKALSPSGALKSIDAFGLPLIVCVDSIDLIKESEDTRQSLYFDLVELDGIIKGRVLYYLRFFENWFSKQYKQGMQIPDNEELFSEAGLENAKVDANIISFEEYQRILDYFVSAAKEGDSPDTSMVYTQTAILLIMGFKLDLRRSEALGLDMTSFINTKDQPDIIINSNDVRVLKTTNASRKFHLEEHLTPDEIQIIIDYLNQLLERFKSLPKYFFACTKTTQQKDYRLINPLMKRIHKITGDDSLKFHNLRHSKASWDMLSLLNTQFDINLESEFFKSSPLTAKYLIQTKGTWNVTLHNPHSIDKGNYFLQKIMGHGQFKTTLKNYIHTLDIASGGMRIKKSREVMTIPWAVKIGVANKNTLYKRLKSNSNKLEVILDSVYQWTQPDSKGSGSSDIDMRNEVQNEKSDPRNLERNTDKKIGYNSPDLEQELYKLAPYCFYQFSLLSEIEEIEFLLKSNRFEQFKERLNLPGCEPNLIKEHFRLNNKFRMKPLIYPQSQTRLLASFKQLPKYWQAAILDQSFFESSEFVEARQLIATLVDRISTSSDSTALKQVKKYDILCHDFNEVSPILELCKLTKTSYSFKFQMPKSQQYDLEDWRSSTGLTEEMLPDSCKQSTVVANTKGRLIIKLQKNPESGSKDLERYFLFTMLQSYTQFFYKS
ncbi:hypothetical protein CYQ88_09850 [Hydrogenovibrio sp. SC-1]|uniref:site-specific integrase n=1 Tax=Hydrogenovibrio sp. SC-1 TaxID=2065820 RepID=UPI000C7B8D58|nr:site-specific integrase [Hydrogenovibrio sp. SC-1]PLA73684.1 hypothetical protein CYQ88_09850 [Hydrogenovibrio sp. SC-1]